MLYAKKTLLRILIFAGALSSCGELFLDVKPDQRQRAPKTTEDFLALLDHSTMYVTSSHALGMIGADEYFVTAEQYNTFRTGASYNYQKNAYTWADIIYEGEEPVGIDWNMGYNRILICNLVLAHTDRLYNEAGKTEVDNLKGMALFFRALNYYNLAQLYCPIYDAQKAASYLGLPLRLEPDVTMHEPRSTLNDTYTRIVRDLAEALALLPEKPLVVFRPGKAAAHMLFARIYLQMDDYAKALEHTEYALDISNELIDFNNIPVTENFSFPSYGEGNPEIILYSSMGNILITSPAYFNVDTSLLDLYDESDIRRELFFIPKTSNTMSFKGSYTGSDLYFTGFATDELYLLRAECLVRLGQTSEALAVLNHLARHRHKSAGFIPYTASNENDLLPLILEERRRELVMRGVRWEDLRRLNKDEKFKRTLVRELGELSFDLEPGSEKWVWPIPLEAIQKGGYVQNSR